MFAGNLERVAAKDGCVRIMKNAGEQKFIPPDLRKIKFERNEPLALTLSPFGGERETGFRGRLHIPTPRILPDSQLPSIEYGAKEPISAACRRMLREEAGKTLDQHCKSVRPILIFRQHGQMFTISTDEALQCLSGQWHRIINAPTLAPQKRREHR